MSDVQDKKDISSKLPLGRGAKAFHIRHFENLHILLWLMKDTCWLMEWKTLGMAMIVPTIGVAIAITIKTFRSDEFWINLAICFWITANSYWMCCEFFKHEELKYYAGFPFALGFVCVGWFYAKNFLRKTDADV